ncbi:MAG: cation-translocating P-type ATPase [Planctomycetota bacterium]|nr:cation-translocating P-type ATPase [Planctomycetota bacterium]
MDRAWAETSDAACRALDVDPAAGLTDEEVRARRARYGPNALRATKPLGALEILLNQVKSLIVLLLTGAAVLSFAFGEWVEGLAILSVLVVNTVLGFVSELRAVRSMEALRKLGRQTTRVLREGLVREVPADELVPGDIVLIEAGDVVTADLRLIDAAQIEADESTLTGESVPVGKQEAPVDADAAIHERVDMLFKGSAVTRGAATGVVVGTGMQTELGRIAKLVEEAHEEVTPLEKRLDALGRRLVYLTLCVAVFTIGLGLLSGESTWMMVKLGIALAVAAIPEGLPVVATMALARGMWRMARRNVLINRLSAVEVLGATTVIMTDKTGTLTENRLSLERIQLESGVLDLRERTAEQRAADAELVDALGLGVLCNNASLGDAAQDVAATGDPLEVALLEAAAGAGIDVEALRAAAPRVAEEAFDPVKRMMATAHERDGGIRVAAKGAAEALLATCTHVIGEDGPEPLGDAARATWLRRNADMARSGLRVLGLAHKRAAHADDLYAGLTFIGLLGLLDPPRSDVKDALSQCRTAGVRVVMVTGDQAATAAQIAGTVGLTEESDPNVLEGRAVEEVAPADRDSLRDVSVFARVSPEQKLDLVALHQQAGEVVAMTGDGVNDAPALKKADIGVAMGRRGTQVAREASDMVLKDDAFASIVAAVREGRVIFDNIRKFVFYLLSCNVSEVIIVSGAMLVQAPMPLLPLQILFLNLVTDVFPALALAFGKGDPRAMHRPPRATNESILPRAHWQAILGYGLLMAVCVLGAQQVAARRLGLSGDALVTVSFLVLALAQLWHVFNVRTHRTNVLKNEVTRNPWVWGAIVLCLGLLLVVLLVPGFAALLSLTFPSGDAWVVILLASLIPLVVGQVLRSTRSGGTA